MPTVRPHLVLLVGDGRVGKSRLTVALAERYPRTYRVVRTDTSRPFRTGDHERASIDAATYRFLDGEEMERNRGEYFTFTPRPQGIYGTRRSELREALRSHHGLITVAPSLVAVYRTWYPCAVILVEAADRHRDTRDAARRASDEVERRIPVAEDFVLQNSFADGGLARSVAAVHDFLLRFTNR